MTERRTKSNKKFMLLSAIGIFMVVDHHTFTALNLFGDYIPYNSFFMPMFVFISGYFNKVDSSTGLLKYVWKKIKNLLIPYAGISLLVFALRQLINWIKLGEVQEISSWYLSYVLQRIITVGSFASVAAPMWFVIALFATLLIYAVLKVLLSKIRIWNSYVMLAVFTGLNILSVFLARNLAADQVTGLLILLKAMFFLPFLEMGILYREHLEQKHSNMSAGGRIGLMGSLLVINVIRTAYMPAPYDIAFDSIDEMAGFTSPFLVTPLISSLIGILFWLTLTDLVGKPFHESRFINYMSCNTFWIMGLHITFFNVLNLILMLIKENIIDPKYFDCDSFRESEWYFWGISPGFKLVYVIIGILGPLGIKLVFDKIVLMVRRRTEKC